MQVRQTHDFGEEGLPLEELPDLAQFLSMAGLSVAVLSRGGKGSAATTPVHVAAVRNSRSVVPGSLGSTSALGSGDIAYWWEGALQPDVRFPISNALARSLPSRTTLSL